MPTCKYEKRCSCVICALEFTTSRYSTTQTCSRRCSGVFQRRNAELPLRLDAFNEWTPDMAYALGLVFSDGNITNPKKGSWRLQFVSTDKQQAQWFHDFVGNPNRLHMKSPKHRMVCGIKLKTRPKTQYTSVTVSDTLVHCLLRLGIRPQKSKEGTEMAVPPESRRADFLRGVFDGDGSIMAIKSPKRLGGISLRTSIVCYPRRDRSMLSQILGTVGIPHTVSTTTLRMDGSQAEMFCKAIYNGAGARLARKAQVWADWCSMRSEFGGLISARDPYETLRGLRPQPWHRWFGEMTDREISERAEVGVSEVARSRKLAGFKPVSPVRKMSPRPWHSMVGTMPDAHIAREMGISPATVLRYRRKKSLPVCDPTRHLFVPDAALVGHSPGPALAVDLKEPLSYG